MKERKAFYCNAKVLLLFLVIYGHLLEKRIADSEIILWQYRAIYAVHIPLFAFLSGMFLKSEYACIKQMLSAFGITDIQHAPLAGFTGHIQHLILEFFPDFCMNTDKRYGKPEHVF